MVCSHFIYIYFPRNNIRKTLTVVTTPRSICSHSDCDLRRAHQPLPLAMYGLAFLVWHPASQAAG